MPALEPVRPQRVIELELHDVSQLFNSMDPSPFVDRDLDADAEEFIVNWAREYSSRDAVTLRIHLEHLPADETAARVQDAVHNFFAYRAKLNRLEFHRLMSEARLSLVIGLGFLAVCLLSRNILLARWTGPWSGFVKESLTIAGWVAMWRPMQMYLYDWWPVRRRGRAYVRLSNMPVEVIAKTKPA